MESNKDYLRKLASDSLLVTTRSNLQKDFVQQLESFAKEPGGLAASYDESGLSIENMAWEMAFSRGIPLIIRSLLHLGYDPYQAQEKHPERCGICSLYERPVLISVWLLGDFIYRDKRFSTAKDGFGKSLSDYIFREESSSFQRRAEFIYKKVKPYYLEYCQLKDSLIQFLQGDQKQKFGIEGVVQEMRLRFSLVGFLGEMSQDFWIIKNLYPPYPDNPCASAFFTTWGQDVVQIANFFQAECYREMQRTLDCFEQFSQKCLKEALLDNNALKAVEQWVQDILDNWMKVYELLKVLVDDKFNDSYYVKHREDFFYGFLTEDSDSYKYYLFYDVLQYIDWCRVLNNHINTYLAICLDGESAHTLGSSAQLQHFLMLFRHMLSFTKEPQLKALLLSLSSQDFSLETKIKKISKKVQSSKRTDGISLYEKESETVPLRFYPELNCLLLKGVELFKSYIKEKASFHADFLEQVEIWYQLWVESKSMIDEEGMAFCSSGIKAWEKNFDQASQPFLRMYDRAWSLLSKSKGVEDLLSALPLLLEGDDVRAFWQLQRAIRFQIGDTSSWSGETGDDLEHHCKEVLKEASYHAVLHHSLQYWRFTEQLSDLERKTVRWDVKARVEKICLHLHLTRWILPLLSQLGAFYEKEPLWMQSIKYRVNLEFFVGLFQSHFSKATQLLSSFEQFLMGQAFSVEEMNALRQEVERLNMVFKRMVTACQKVISQAQWSSFEVGILNVGNWEQRISNLPKLVGSRPKVGFFQTVGSWLFSSAPKINPKSDAITASVPQASTYFFRPRSASQEEILQRAKTSRGALLSFYEGEEKEDAPLASSAKKS